MPDPTAHPAALNASPEDAEAQFYEAVRDGDLNRLMTVWADDDDVVCVHPGGTRVVGPQAVHSVLERIDVVTSEGPRTGWIVATKVYVTTGEGWRMVADHASPGPPDEIPEIIDNPSVLH